MSLESDYQEFKLYHAKYEQRALRMFLKAFRDLFSNIKFDNLSLDLRVSEMVIALNINEEELRKILYKVHYSIGLEYGRIQARKIRKENPIEQKAFTPLPFFDEAFQSYLLEWFNVYGGTQIKILSKTAIKSVVVEMKKSLRENETVEQMRSRIMMKVKRKDFYSWQAMRIARTETTIAMNAAKELATVTSGVEMDKIWLTRMDGKERYSHGAVNRTKVGQKELFEVGGYKMKFPGDRTNGAPAKQIVNCRCTYSYQARRDANGRLQFNDEAEIQAMLRQMGK